MTKNKCYKYPKKLASFHARKKYCIHFKIFKHFFTHKRYPKIFASHVKERNYNSYFKIFNHFFTHKQYPKIFISHVVEPLPLKFYSIFFITSSSLLLYTDYLYCKIQAPARQHADFYNPHATSKVLH